MSAAEAPHLEDQGGDKGYFATETEDTHALAGMSGNTTGVVVENGTVVRSGVETDPAEPPADEPPPANEDGLDVKTNPELRDIVVSSGLVEKLPSGVKLARANKAQLLEVLRA